MRIYKNNNYYELLPSIAVTRIKKPYGTEYIVTFSFLTLSMEWEFSI